MHLCFVVYEYRPEFKQAEALLDDYFSMTEWCELLAEQGCKVSVVIRFFRKDFRERKGVAYYFVADDFSPALGFWQIPKRMHRFIRQLQPEILHFHNFNKVLQLRHLLRLTRHSIPVVLQNHGETPRFWIRRLVQRRVFRGVKAFVFTAPGQEKVWRQKGLIPSTARVDFIMEASNYFRPRSRSAARKKTGLTGQPVFLWIGNLNKNKDPLTILKAFRRIKNRVPRAHLYLIYRFDDLKSEVIAYLKRYPALEDSVFLLGAKKREELEDFYNSADYYLLGSRKEYTGYSAMEAIACGVVPVLTDIPAFRLLTNNGKIGGLWQTGNVDDLEQTIYRVMETNLEEASREARLYFERKLSYAAQVPQMMDCYKSLHGRESGKDKSNF